MARFLFLVVIGRSARPPHELTPGAVFLPACFLIASVTATLVHFSPSFQEHRQFFNSNS